MADIAGMNLSNTTRQVFTYELPGDSAPEGKPLNGDSMQGIDPYVKKSIGLVKLTMSEEIAGSDRAMGNQARLSYAWARLALVEVDGRVLNKAEAEDETILERTDPAIRELILAAFADMSTTRDGAAKKFLASKKVRLG